MGDHAATTDTWLDYSIVGPQAERARAAGLVGADWYRCPVPRDTMRQLMKRRNGPAIRDTLIWVALLGASGYWAFIAWGSWWALPAFAVYGTLYGSASDARWHEMGHGTAFKTQWLNAAVYRVASFMVLRESVSWRWSHARHHSDTIVVGSDPEIAVPRPPSWWRIALDCFGVLSAISESRKLAYNVAGKLTPEEADFIPESAARSAIRGGRTDAAILVGVAVWCVAIGSIEPAMFIGLPSMYGRWLLPVYGLTQHAGLAENVLDHRLNCRTVSMNVVNRFLYKNMNFHVEHHMFPTVPYHALPALHEAVKDDTPPVYPSILAAYREIIPALRRQRRDPSYCVVRPLPGAAA